MLLHTRSRRRALATVLALLVLLCQAAFIAQACAKVGSGGDLASVECHGSTDTDAPSPGHDRLRPGCEAPALTAEPVTTVFAAAISLVTFAVGGRGLQPADRAAPIAFQVREAQCRPPPFTILHCRFLI
jgi:hypothetical protein